MKVLPKNFGHRQVAGGPAIGCPAGLEDQPSVRELRVQELMDEARLADSRLTHDGDDLPMALTRSFLQLLQSLNLVRASDEFRQPESRDRPRSRTRGIHTQDLVGFDRSRQPSDDEPARAIWSPPPAVRVVGYGT